MQIYLTVTRWNAQIEPNPQREQYAGYDGRILYLNAKFRSQSATPNVEMSTWELNLIPSADPINGACGSVLWFGAPNTLSFRAEIGIARQLWEDLWTRSMTPPAVCEVWFDMDSGGDFTADARDIAIRAPIFRMSSN